MTYNANNIRKVHAVPHYFWSTISWSELNLDESIAWGILGYDMEKWDNNMLEIHQFVEYDDIQQKVIIDLGYKDYTWDAKPVNPKFPAILLDDEENEEISVENIIEYWDVHNWEDLDKYQKELFLIVGFDEESFDYNIYPEINWEDFNEEQKDCLTFLGYNQPIWNEILYDQLDDYEDEDNDKAYEIELVIELEKDEQDDEEDKLSLMEKGILEKKKSTDFLKALQTYNTYETKLIIDYFITLKLSNKLKNNYSFNDFVKML